MRSSLPFDKKNAEDFFKVSKAIQEALEMIRSDVRLKPTQAALSKLSGVHRNILRNRKWPLEELDRIGQERLVNHKIQTESRASQEKKLLQESLDGLRKRLDLSREEASKWFHTSEKFKSELESLKGVNRLLKVKINEQQALIDELRCRAEQLNVTVLRKRGKNETISPAT